jgi:L-rhamnose-H+ transport protein
MSDDLLIGLGIVLLAGLFQGSFMLPSKWMSGWAWENYWLIFAAAAYLVCPWLLALATIPDLLDVYRGASIGSVVWVVVFGLGWGIGAGTFGLGVEAIGLSLGFAVILGVAATSGTLIPLLVQPPANFSATQGVVTAASLVVMLLGVAVCSFAGGWKEEKEGGASTPRRFSYRLGVVVCILSGLLSSCGNLGFAFGEVIYSRAAGPNVPAHLAPNALWPILTPPLFLCNAGYALYLLRRDRTGRNYRDARSARNIVFAILMGVLWMAGMALYGIGANRLGRLGPSLGWAILMSSMVLVANALGVLSGEWRSAPRRAMRQLAVGLALLLVAITGLGYANSLQQENRPSTEAVGSLDTAPASARASVSS